MCLSLLVCQYVCMSAIAVFTFQQPWPSYQPACLYQLVIMSACLPYQCLLCRSLYPPPRPPVSTCLPAIMSACLPYQCLLCRSLYPPPRLPVFQWVCLFYHVPFSRSRRNFLSLFLLSDSLAIRVLFTTASRSKWKSDSRYYLISTCYEYLTNWKITNLHYIRLRYLREYLPVCLNSSWAREFFPKWNCMD